MSFLGCRIAKEGVAPTDRPTRRRAPSVGPKPCYRGLSARQLQAVTTAIVESIAEPISVAALSSVLGLSRSYFSHAFRRTVGWTPHAHVVRLRLERAMMLMERTETSLTEVALAAGFADQSHFSRSFRRLTGITPADWRKAHKRPSFSNHDVLASCS